MTSIAIIIFAIALFVVGWQLGSRSGRTLHTDEMHDLKAELRAEMHRLLAEHRPAPAASSAAPLLKAPVEAAVPPAAAVAPAPGQVVTDSKTIAILAATVAAYLGKQVRVRQARLIGPSQSVNSWAQAGRVSIQGSHVLGRR